MKKFFKALTETVEEMLSRIIIFFYGALVLAIVASGRSIRSDLLVIIVFSILGLTVIFAYIYITKKTTDNTKTEIDEYYNNAKSAITKSEGIHANSENIVDENTIDKDKSSNGTKDSNDIIELMLLNMKEIKEYYVLSKTMAKRSFTLSVVMCILGFLIIVISITAIFIIDISFAQSLAPMIGGVVVEVIAGTSLVVYKKSLEQLNQYYESLHSNERFLSLVNLVDKLSDDKKDETYINIINNQLNALTNSK